MAQGPGFVTSNLVSFGIDAMRAGYSTTEGEKAISRIDEAIHHSPIIQASAIARFPLLTGGSWNNPMTIFADQTIATDRDVNLNAVTPGFLETMGIKLLAGRNFDNNDISRQSGPGWRSVIVSESFVKRYLARRNPLGTRICEGTGPNAKPTMEIVGVMSDFSYRGLRDNSEQAYFPFFEGEHPLGTFYVRLRGTPEASLESLRAMVRGAAPSLPMTDFRTLDEQVHRSLNSERMLATLSASFSALALLLSVIGLYGVMSFVVTQRTHEIGIRLALGARRWSTLCLVLRDGVVMIVSGIAIGLPLVLALGRLAESQLYQVKSWDPAVIAIAIVALCLAGLGATLLPAHRASGVNAIDALRVE
jgi:predicted permease